jgi:ParB family chromosome partitioning protein
LLNAFKRESQRQKLMVKKARICEAKLVLIATAFGRLLADENFVTLLRAESLAEMPKYLNDKVRFAEKEAA